ncbi:MAG: hypothetical protein A2157_20130 [Deltaproteobacteria bacterium RBG_16_47_11]|nr:MAG: hypothetical protein A2157_20130 [Deltaproteobacteria bacterium RBG_16_47_11]
MEKKKLGSILTGIGIVLLLVSVFADPLGIGGYLGFGYKQIIGAVLGIVIGIIGALLYRK